MDKLYKDNLIQFMSYKIQEKTNNSLKLTPSPSVAFIRIKAKKISIAIYLITDFIPNGDPIKNHLREKSVKLISELSFIESLQDNSSIKVIFNIISEKIELLDISNTIGFISDMNHSILKSECNSLIDFIHEQSNTNLNRDVFSKDFFNISDEELIDNLNDIKNDNYSYKNNSKLTTMGSIKDKNNTLSPKDIKKQTKGQQRTPVYVGRNIQKGSENSVVNEKKNNRRGAILNMLKKQRKITVKDIANEVKNCSEKTLQRELISLVKEGVLRKEGERRWSTYSIA